MYVSKVAKRFKGQWNSVVTKSLNFIPSQSRTMSHARKKLKDLNKQRRELNQNDYFLIFFFTCGKWCGTKESILEWLFKGTTTCMWLEQHVCESFQFSHYEWQRLIAVIVIMLSPIWHWICDSLLIGCIIKLSVFKNILPRQLWCFKILGSNRRLKFGCVGFYNLPKSALKEWPRSAKSPFAIGYRSPSTI